MGRQLLTDYVLSLYIAFSRNSSKLFQDTSSKEDKNGTDSSIDGSKTPNHEVLSNLSGN